MQNEFISYYLRNNSSCALVNFAEERNIEILKDMYPLEVRVIQTAVEEEISKEDVAGSRIYDEYPDKMYIMLLRNRIYDKLPENIRNKSGDRTWLNNLIEILLYNEIYIRKHRI